MSLTSEIRGALEVPHPDDVADRVHHLVAKALHTLDTDVEIKRTHYFTHTIVPGRKGTVVAPRWVFARRAARA